MRTWLIVFGFLILPFLTLAQEESDLEVAAPSEEVGVDKIQQTTLPEDSLEESLEPEMSVERMDQILRKQSQAHHDPSTNEEKPDVLDGVIRYIEDEEYLIEQERKKAELELSKKFSDRVRDFHTNMSENIVGMADTIDSFFINKAITDGRNRTNIRLTNISNWVEREGVTNDFDFKLRLRLPHLRKKIQIEFEDDSLVDETVSARDNLTPASAPVNRVNQQGGSRGGLSFYERFIGLDTKLSTGLQLNNEVIVFGRFRIARDFILTPKQKITFIHDVFDDTTNNRGQIGILNYDYTFNKFFLFRLVNEETYRDINNTFQTTHGFSLYQQLSDRSFLSYNYRVESVNLEARSSFFLNSHVVNLSFRRRLYREHLFYETGPGMIFPKALDFEGQWAFIFKLEVIFGNV